MSSIFTRPRARPPLAAVSSQQNLIAVSTEDELLAALTSLPRSDGSCYGRGISIVGDITLKRPVVLGAQHKGLTISSPTLCRINTATSLDYAFNSFASSDILVKNISLGSTFSADTFIFLSNRASIESIVVYPGATLDSLVAIDGYTVLSIRQCSCKDVASVSGIKLIKAAATGSGAQVDGIVEDNDNFTGGLPSVSFVNSMLCKNKNLGVWQDDTGSYPTENTMCFANTFVKAQESDPFGDGNITLSNASSLNNAIYGNCLNGCNINTSGSAGGNTIVGNTNVGVITPAGTDAVTSNT